MTILSTLKRATGGLIAAVALSAPAAAQTAFAPVVVVNDDVITYYDVTQRARLLAMSGAQPSPQLNSAALEQLIDDRLRSQAGRRANIDASPEAIKGAVDEFAQRFGIDGAALLTRVDKSGVDRASFDNFLASQVVWRDLVNARFGSRATPSEVELDQEIALAASNNTKSYRLSEISLPSGPGQENEVRATIGRIMAELQRGASFTSLARRYSRAPSARNGGDVGWVPATVLPAELAELVAATAPGGVTPPFATPSSVSIYRVSESREDIPPWARESTVTLRRIAVPGDAEDAHETARDLMDETNGCGGLPSVEGRATVESIDRKLVSALPGPVRDAVQFLQTGQASRPVRGENSVDVYVVCEKSGGVDDETRTQLREQIRTQRLTRLADGYLQDLRREAVIERR
ncbi:MAG: peptidylprolyl isomerase [Pikeienuella sp.]